MTTMQRAGWTATTASLLLIGCSSHAAIFSGTAAPDLGKRLVAERAAVSSASPLASEAGLEVLRAGGNAVDAAVATAFAVGVVEPQMSGLGGSGSALVWMQGDGHADYLDFYASQPVQAFRTLENPAVDSTTPLRIVGVFRPPSVRLSVTCWTTDSIRSRRCGCHVSSPVLWGCRCSSRTGTAPKFWSACGEWGISRPRCHSATPGSTWWFATETGGSRLPIHAMMVRYGGIDRETERRADGWPPYE